MNIGFCTCTILALLFLILSVIFALLKEKGANYVSGFNTLNHPEKYVRYHKNGRTEQVHTHPSPEFSVQLPGNRRAWNAHRRTGAYRNFRVSGFQQILSA